MRSVLIQQRHTIRNISRYNVFLFQCRFFSIQTRSSVDDKKLKQPPKLNVKWLYATDVPNSKPGWFNYTKEKEPEKFIPFSVYDSDRLEKRFHSLYSDGNTDPSSHLVEVCEDKLFQVNLMTFEISPVYWEGPIYEVRRGTWFASDGTPLPNNLAEAIEAGYQSRKPYKFDTKNNNQVPKLTKECITKFNQEISNAEITEGSLEINVEKEKDIVDLENGKLVLYYNDKYAVIFPSSIKSKFQVGVIRNFGPSPVSLISVDQIQRGYSDDLNKTVFDNLPSNPIPGLADTFKNEVSQLFNPSDHKKSSGSFKEPSSFSNENDGNDTQQNEQMKNVLEADFDRDTSPNNSNREIDHLILCIHGIGQILGHKYESVNFTHSINVLRNTMKSVYQDDKYYKKIAYTNGKNKQSATNNRIQVLPISWRHKIDFQPQKNFKAFDEKGEYRLPTLSQINVDGVKSLRNILGDVVLDVLLYYEPKYINQIYQVVTEELNRVYKLYTERNPQFKGKVHIIGHSLGSAISFDILASQLNDKSINIDLTKDLSFEVEDLFCVGSPVGVFKLLEQTNIRPRSLVSNDFDPRDKANEIASPKCKNLFNIFHPCDPVSYRMEPLISPKFSNFKPESVPFAVKNINTQIKGLAEFGDEITEKISKASGWFRYADKKKSSNTRNSQEEVSKENALGDTISSLAILEKKDEKPDKKSKRVEIEKNDLKLLISINKTGRVDYCLPMGVFNISLVSAISAHVSYFEDKDTAGFIMREVLASNLKPFETKTASLYK